MQESHKECPSLGGQRPKYNGSAIDRPSAFALTGSMQLHAFQVSNQLQYQSPPMRNSRMPNTRILIKISPTKKAVKKTSNTFHDLEVISYIYLLRLDRENSNRTRGSKRVTKFRIGLPDNVAVFVVHICTEASHDGTNHDDHSGNNIQHQQKDWTWLERSLRMVNSIQHGRFE